MKRVEGVHLFRKCIRGTIASTRYLQYCATCVLNMFMSRNSRILELFCDSDVVYGDSVNGDYVKPREEYSECRVAS
jgi:hypothetical protein